jgi:ACDE family multidrug resistance protein
MSPGGSSGRVAPARPRPPLALVYSLTVTGVLANTLVAPVVPDILHDLGVAQSSAGLVLAAATLPGIVLAPVIGVLADRYGRRAVLIPCLVVFGIGGVANAFASSFGTLLALRFLQGIGGAGLVNLAVVLIGDHWSGVERARVIGHNAAALTLALAVLPPLGGGLADVAGWEAVFLLYGVAFVTAVGVARLVPPTPRRDSTMREQLRQAAPYLRSGHMIGVVVMGILAFVLIFGLFLTVLPLYLENRFGLDAGGRGLVLAAPAVTSTVAAFFLGALRARLRRGVLLRASIALFVVSFVAIWGVASLPVLVGAALVYGLGEGVLISLLQDEAAGAAPTASRGAVVAVWVGGARAGQTIGPLLAGVGLDTIGARGTFAAGAAVAVGLAGVQALSGEPTVEEVTPPVLPEPAG